MLKRTSLPQAPGEQPFWQLAGAVWHHLAGSFDDNGYSIEWHDWDGRRPLNWAESFHPRSVEVCLNLEGAAWVAAGGVRMDLAPDTVGFIVVNGQRPEADRQRGQHHRFLSVEFSIPFLRQRLGAHKPALHPLVRRCLDNDLPAAAVSGAAPLSHRQRDLLGSLLHPPVLASAQRLWYEVKALEFAAELFFAAADETLCTRAQRVAAKRVAQAKTVLMNRLAEPPSLEELGRQVGCSPFYLSRTFTRETGLTITQWLRRARLERAAELLRSGKCNVTEAALEVGYSSLSHFSETFHEMFGCCPGLYPCRTPTQQRPPPDTSSGA